jgi:hypothetical protein
MISLQLVEAAGRAAFLAASMCTGDAITAITNECVRVQGNATCSMPTDVKVSGETLFLEWREDHRWPSVLVKGSAVVQRGSDRFSANDAWLRWEARPAMRLVEVWFFVDPHRTFDLRCSQ